MFTDNGNRIVSIGFITEEPDFVISDIEDLHEEKKFPEFIYRRIHYDNMKVGRVIFLDDPDPTGLDFLGKFVIKRTKLIANICIYETEDED